MSRRLAVLPAGLVGTVDPGLGATAGRFVVEAGGVSFLPRFPLLRGGCYSLLLTQPGGEEPVEEWRFRVPAAAPAPGGRVVTIRPATPEVPLNLLRVYLHFSRPMAEGRSHRCVQVRRADTGQVLDGAFLPMDPELWDPGRRRLTLLLDPGRIKRGLAPHEQVGYPLSEGVPVEVVVDASYPDAAGRPLRRGAARTYRVGPAVRRLVDPGAWGLEVPRAGSADPLVVRFDRPLDPALLRRCLAVLGPDGRLLDGRTEGGRGERSWRLHPARPWTAAEHHLVVDASLEDLAGNSAVRVFDRDLSRPEEAAGPPRPRPFRPAGG